MERILTPQLYIMLQNNKWTSPSHKVW